MTASEFYGQLQNSYDMAIPENEMATYYNMLAKENGHESYAKQMLKARINRMTTYMENTIQSSKSWLTLGNETQAKILMEAAERDMYLIGQMMIELMELSADELEERQGN